MGKVVREMEALVGIVEGLKAQGKRIVLSNGCFDLLHVGHIRYLRGARALGDVLVVAVNGDDFIRARKGPTRPLFSLEERMELLEALECVDYLFPFSEPKVDGLLRRLRPHVHAKGTDYTLENVPERETSLACGIEIAIVGDEKNHSSSALIETIRQEGEGG